MADKIKKPTKPSTHPKFKDMINTALLSLHERAGTSRISIEKYLLANYKVENNKQFRTNLKRTLKSGIANDTIILTKGMGVSGSFKLAKAEKQTQKAKPSVKKVNKKPAAKKPAARKPAAKKATAKKPATKTLKPKSKKVIKKTAAKKPAAKKPAVKKPVVKKPKSKKPVKK